MHILVAGGTGFIGKNVCSELVDRDHTVTALSRSSDEALSTGVSHHVGDVTDRSTLDEPLADADVVINLVALSPLFKTPKGQTHESVHLGGTENLVDAARANNVDRFVQQSGLGVDPNGPTAYLRAKGQAEAVVRNSDLDWTITRPSVIFGEGDEFVGFTKRTKRLFAPLVPIAPLPGGGSQTRFQPIWVGDFAPVLADIAVKDDYVGDTLEFGGPRELTLADVTRMVFQADGRRVWIVSIPMPVAKVGVTIMEYVPYFPFGLDQYRSLRINNTTDNNSIERFVQSTDNLTTFEEYLGL